jgi:hypothetical protein
VKKASLASGSAASVAGSFTRSKELKEPIQGAVTACGWTYKGMAFGKLRVSVAPFSWEGIE